MGPWFEPGPGSQIPKASAIWSCWGFFIGSPGRRVNFLITVNNGNYSQCRDCVGMWIDSCVLSHSLCERMGTVQERGALVNRPIQIKWYLCGTHTHKPNQFSVLIYWSIVVVIRYDPIARMPTTLCACARKCRLSLGIALPRGYYFPASLRPHRTPFYFFALAWYCIHSPVVIFTIH